MPSPPPAVFPTYFYLCSVQSQYSKIETVESKADQAFQQASDGKTAIANAISGKGVAASASETFTSLASKITNNLYKPPTSQSGSTSCVCTLNGSTSNVLVKFPQGFETIPKVIVSASFSDMNYIKSYAATQISKTGFTATVTAAKASVSSAQNTKFTVTISWNASV